VLLLYFVLGGLIIGTALGGRPSELSTVRFRWWPVALGGLGFQVLLFSEPLASWVGPAGPALYVVSTLVVLAALLADRALPGFRLIALGATLNLAAILANGGLMPASAEAFEALTGRAAVPSETFSNSTLAAPEAALAVLGDNFVLPRPFPFANVFSIGDVVIGVGAAFFVVRVMVGGRSALPAGLRATGLADG
jgi:hypothetical protein